ncbi:phosphoglycolate phosphatase-like HAD superfamily hydrolase [Solirubrobacter pauli]|uniref:Phosphoglycolate phosphatase-like HAD superfamily hydrolase n=2 Tax=Solirubrobacter pauli TaxID=166793 RepID=A0A660LD46_9ACTN|nr:phosphoglycolate phosphatase-like HAD superfamily hydrolase [Solirubrobacter pauli]
MTEEMDRIVIFDLDDTLVHSNAVREAFACVARERGIDEALMTRTLDTLPGRPAQDIFECLGLGPDAAQAATTRFLARLDELNGEVPTVPYADAHATLDALAARGCTLALSTGSPPERARRILENEGWDAFEVVLGSTETCRKGRAHYEQMNAATPDPRWTHRAITVGDSPADMRLGAEYGVPIRIGIDRDGDPRALLAAGATHIVRGLADILRIIPT